MPNLDGGHYFLTVLAPIRADAVTDPATGAKRSHRHLLAQKLSLLPTGRQTPQSPANAWPSPFARNTKTHLARFVIIDDPAFNGRLSQDALLGIVRRTDPLTPQPVDGLNAPYLLFAADVDAQDGTGEGLDALRAYAEALWSTMAEDLTEIFGHCLGFEGVATGGGFFDYLVRCQVETTMPFNDYWAHGLQVGKTKLPLTPLIVAAGVAVVALALWLVSLAIILSAALLGWQGRLVQAAGRLGAWGAIGVPVLICVAVLAVVGLYRWFLSTGRRPFPSAPGADLPSVLKALFVQQHFIPFAVEAQGLGAAELHARFGRFLAAVQPAEATPTQRPGEIRADKVRW